MAEEVEKGNPNLIIRDSDVVPILRSAPATLLQTEVLIVIHGSSGDVDRDRAESKVRHRRFGN